MAYGFIIRHLGNETVGWLVRIVDKAAVMLLSVAYNKALYTKHHIVPDNLVENCLRYSYMRSFIFDNCRRLAEMIHYYRVASASGAVKGYGYLVSH